MNFKTLFITLALMSFFQMAHAQMTDDQVKSYAVQRKTAGATARTIGNELISQGATVDQLKRIAKEMQGQNTAEASTFIEIDRERSNNEETGNASTAEDGRRIFGHDIFRSKELSFEPNMAMAVSPTYALAPGDELIVDVYGASQNSQKLSIAPDGSVTIPKIGPVNVSGLTVEQAQNRIRGAMGIHYKNSSIKVSVGQTRTIKINIMGEVRTPGTYTLSAFATVFHALYMAGGVNELGTMRDIKVARNGRTISTVDVYEYILTGRLAGNISLQDNDVIIVGSYTNLVHISGNVKRPMWYEMKKNETISSLIRFCGGFTGDAYSKALTVNRRAGEKLSVYTVDEFDFGKFKLADEDQINVDENEQRYENMVRVAGAVKRAGRYGLATSNTVRQLIEAAGGLDEEANTSRAIITRMNEDRTRKTIAIDLKGIMDGTTPDVALANEDVLNIATNAKLNDVRKMTIEGEVWDPGTFDYADNTTVEDLILKAGGLKESASLLNVEISRRIIDPSAPKDTTYRCVIIPYTLSSDPSVNNTDTLILKPYDIVNIRRSPVYEAQRTVNISGEIQFAGNYTLDKNEVRLSEIVKKAGGFKDKAVPENAKLVRRMNNQERERERQLKQLENNATDNIDVDSTNSTYTVAINLKNAMENPGCDEDLIMRDGDQIIIPSMINTVRISGEVLYPNNVTYIEGQKKKYYIHEAGGYTKNSLKRRTYVVYANGNVGKLRGSKIQPGCEIVVPTKPEKKDNSGDVMKWVTIGSSVATVAAVLISVLKK